LEIVAVAGIRKVFMNIGEGGRKTAAAGLKSNERVTIAAFTRAPSLATTEATTSARA